MFFHSARGGFLFEKNYKIFQKKFEKSLDILERLCYIIITARARAQKKGK